MMGTATAAAGITKRLRFWRERRNALADVHVLRWDHGTDDSARWFGECLEALLAQPVNVYVLAGDRGETAAARLEGFSYGTTEIVAYVDDDDVPAPGAFDKAVGVLRDRPDVVATFNHIEMIDESSRSVFLSPRRAWSPILQRYFSYVMHLHVLRRASAERYAPEALSFPVCEEQALMGLMIQDGDLYRIDAPLVRMRLRRCGRSMRSKIERTELAAVTERIMPILDRAQRDGRRQID